MERHSVLEADSETRTGVCSLCGPVKLRWKKSGNGYSWRCKSAERRWAGRRLAPVSAHKRKQMIEEQDGRCATCGDPLGDALVVDHCHRTNKVREALCNKCNVGIGLFDDDPDLLEVVAEYLRKHQD